MSGASHTKLNEYKISVNKLKESYVGFHIKKDDLKNEIKVVKIGKRDVINRIKVIEKKMNAQDKVNSMFTTSVINESTVTSQPIKDTLTANQIGTVKKSLNSKDTSAWMISLQGLVDDASAQVQQIKTAKQLVGGLIQNGKVTDGVSGTGYEQALAEVYKIKNDKVKQDLLKQLDQVLQVVTTNEQAQATKGTSQGATSDSANVNRSNSGNSGFWSVIEIF